MDPEQFTAARNQLAESARAANDEATAAAIMAMRKPTVTAWLANQLVRTDPDGIHALTELGEDLRLTFLSADAARRRELTRLRRELVSGLAQTARERAAGGKRVTAQTVQRLIETLDAAVADSGAAQLLRTGQLTSGLWHVGFGIVDESGDLAQLAAARPRVVRRSPPRKPSINSALGRGRSTESRPTVDRTLQDRRNAQRKRADQAEEDYAAAESEREQAELVLELTSIASPTSFGSTTNSSRPARPCGRPANRPRVSNRPSTRRLATRPPLRSAVTPRTSDSTDSTVDHARSGLIRSSSDPYTGTCVLISS